MALPIVLGDPDPFRDPGTWPFPRRGLCRAAPYAGVRGFGPVRQGHGVEGYRDIARSASSREIGKTVDEDPFRYAPMGPVADWKAFGCLSSCPAGPISNRRLAARRSGTRFYGRAEGGVPWLYAYRP